MEIIAQIVTILLYSLIVVGSFQIFKWINLLLDNVLKSILATCAIVIFFTKTNFMIYGVLSLTLLVAYIIKYIKNKPKKKEVIIRDNNEAIYLETNIGTVTIENIYRGSIIMGGAGSGKSKSIFYPMIQQFIENDFSGILYDFKSPELSEVAHFYHKTDGLVNFAFLNFKDFENSVRVNPLSPKYINKQAVAFELATVFINNLLPESIKKKDYWTRSSISIVAGVIWYLRNNYPNLCSIPHLIAIILDFSSPLLIEKLTEDRETSGMISSLKEAHEMNAEKQIAGVVGTLKMAIAQLNMPEVYYLLSKDEINLELNNPENPTFLSIGNDSSLSDTFSPVISLVVSVCSRLMNQKNKHKSVIILDEAPTLYIPNFEQIPATGRSNKIATVYGLQDYSQMIDKYGREKAQVMISNLGNQFFGRTVNEQTSKMIINMFGKHDVIYTSHSNSKGESSSGNSESNTSTDAYQQRERVSIQKITNMPSGTFYGVIAEGNKKELLGVRMVEVEANYKPFEGKQIAETPKDVFNRIYNEIQLIKKTNNNNNNNNIEEPILNEIKIDLG